MQFVQNILKFGKKNFNLTPYTYYILIFGIFFKLFLFNTFSPPIVTKYYIPFINNFIENPSFYPWYNWLINSGDPKAFPYGYGMIISLYPFFIFSKIFSFSSTYSYFITLLFFDLGVYFILNLLIKNRNIFILIFYWFSPIILLSIYILGYNDIIPVFFLLLSIKLLHNKYFFWSGFSIIFSISVKLSMVISLPFFIIYFIRNKSIYRYLSTFIKGFILSSILFIIPLLFSNISMNMILKNPEMDKIYNLSIVYSSDVTIYIIPLVYILILYFTWRINRLNFTLFHSIIGISFLFIVLLMPSAPGWFVWSFPFLVLFLSSSHLTSSVLILIFSILYFFNYLLLNSINVGSYQFDLYLIITNHLSFLKEYNFGSIFHTFLLSFGFILIVRIWRKSINNYDFFKISNRPFLIGISGDSGTGKDTLANSIISLFGKDSTVHISGDDYHLGDRKKPIWQIMTHLNPMANNLEAFSNDILKLLSGKVIKKRYYDHSEGKMSKFHKIKSNNIIISSGLHTLYKPILREFCDLKIFLEMNEDLRIHYKLIRDENERKQNKNDILKIIKKRKKDAENFIIPQSKYADLIFHLNPINKNHIDYKSKKIPLKIKIISKNIYNEISLQRMLIGYCGLNVIISYDESNSSIIYNIDGDVNGNDLKLIAKKLYPDIFDFLDLYPEWYDGMLGVMQIFILNEINYKLNTRIYK